MIFGDNQPAISSVGNDLAKSRTKHIDVRLKLKFCGEVVCQGFLQIKAVLNDQCGSVCKVLSVRRRRPRFARLPGAFGPTPADSLRSSADRGLSRLAFNSDGTGHETRWTDDT